MHLLDSLNHLIIATQNEQVIQFDLNPGRSIHKIQKIYYVSIGLVSVISSCGNLVALGGKSAVFQFIDAKKRLLFDVIYPVANRYIRSLEFCRVSKWKTLLCVGGKYTNFSQKKTNVFDVTKLVEKVNGK